LSHIINSDWLAVVALMVGIAARFIPVALRAYMHRYDRRPIRAPLQTPAEEEAQEAGARGLPAVVRTEPTRRKPASEKTEAPPPATSAIVTIRKRASDRVPELTPEEHQRRGDAADAMFREMKRKIAATK
jgi:hypothetical protein